MCKYRRKFRVIIIIIIQFTLYSLDLRILMERESVMTFIYKAESVDI